jgi:hypothetical protein
LQRHGFLTANSRAVIDALPGNLFKGARNRTTIVAR